MDLGQGDKLLDIFNSLLSQWATLNNVFVSFHYCLFN